MEMAKTEPALQRFSADDKHASLDVWMRGTCGARCRVALGRALPGALDQAVADADTFFGERRRDGERARLVCSRHRLRASPVPPTSVGLSKTRM
jgi:hypothetical protein